MSDPIDQSKRRFSTSYAPGDPIANLVASHAPARPEGGKPPCTTGACLLLRLMVPCDLEAVRNAALAAREALAAHGAAEGELMGCELALVEGCNNAILYASETGREKPIEIQLLAEGVALEMQVIDHTRGFDWPQNLELPGPEEEHGRGLFIIQSMMDDVFYLRGNSENRLVMRKAKIFRDHSGSPPVSAQLEHTREKLALSEQVISTMAKELYTQIVSARVQQEQVDGRLLAHELEIARKIQHSLLPKTFPSLPGFGLSGFCLSARQVGGDFYDVLPISSDLVLLVVADVMGKGVPAALFAATLRTLVRTTVQWIRRPAKLLRRINRLMFEDLSGVDMFITAQLVLVDTRVGRLVVASAGHCPLLLTDGNGQVETVSPEGMPLGILPEAEFEEEVVPLWPSSCAVMYSDGLTEARNPHGELFGDLRLTQWLTQNLNREQNAAQMTSNIQADLKRFQSTVSPADDQTVLILAPDRMAACQPETEFLVPLLARAQQNRASA